MTNARTLLALAVAVLLLGACTSSPTSSRQPDAARLDAAPGGGFGSGNVVALDDNTTTGTAPTLDTAPADSTLGGDDTGRGGHGYGSGN